MSEYNEVSGEEVKDAMLAKNITNVHYRHCSICGYGMRYLVRNDVLFFDAGCNCVSHNETTPRSWGDAAYFINIQDDDHKQEVADRFGVTLNKRGGGG